MNPQVSVMGIAKKDNYIYAISSELNLLYEIDIELDDVSCFKDMPDEEYMKDNLYSGICIEDDNLALIPQNAKKLWIYHFNVQKWESFDISDFISEDMDDKFIGGQMVCGRLYLFGYQYQGILVFDLETKKFWNLFKEEKYKTSFWGKSTVLADKKVYIPFRKEKSVVCINAEKNDYEIIDMKVEGADLGNPNDGIAYNGREFYILQNHGNYLYKYQCGVGAEQIFFDTEYSNGTVYFNAVECIENKVLLCGPGLPNYLFDTEEPQKSSFINEAITYAKTYPNIGILICKKGKIQLCDSNLKIIKEYKTEIDSEMMKAYFSKAKLANSVMFENNVYGINEMIDILIRG